MRCGCGTRHKATGGDGAHRIKREREGRRQGDKRKEKRQGVEFKEGVGYSAVGGSGGGMAS